MSSSKLYFFYFVTLFLLFFNFCKSKVGDFDFPIVEHEDILKVQVTVNKPFNQIEEANKICNPPQPDPSHSLSLLSRILSLVSAMVEPMVLLVSGGDKTTTVREGFGMPGEKRYRD